MDNQQIIVIEITDPGRAESATAGKCKCPQAGMERAGTLRHDKAPNG